MTFESSRLKITYDTGEVNDNYRAIMTSKSYSDVRDGATKENLLEVVNALSTLCDYSMHNAVVVVQRYVVE